MTFSYQDAAAALVAVILSLGIVYLSAVHVEIPQALATSEGSAIAWLFVRSAQEGAKSMVHGNP